jgi:hypothetical protein
MKAHPCNYLRGDPGDKTRQPDGTLYFPIKKTGGPVHLFPELMVNDLKY